MKQLLQSLKTGDIELADIPCPQIGSGKLLIKTHISLISSGTERMLLQFGKSNWLEKAKSQPDKVRAVLNKIKTDGILPTLEAVQHKLEQPIPLGYSNVGTVIGIGDKVRGFKIGDRVVSNGSHAEVVCVPQNLSAKIPDNVDDESAAFAVIASIALQAIRLTKPTLGETIVVIGLGLIGLLTTQLLAANGCNVIGVDYDENKLALAKSFGIQTINPKQQEVVNQVLDLTGHVGADGVIIAASTDSHQPIQQAAQMSRKRGRIILVGVTGLQLSRADFYEKELTFQVSCSYGPGRYDDHYEKQGHDYPLAYVRWTEQRNFQAVLDTMATNKLILKPLISHQFDFYQAQQAYQLLNSDSNYTAILLRYPQQSNTLLQQQHSKIPLASGHQSSAATVRMAIIGCGNYAARILVPAFKKTSAELVITASSNGISGYLTAKRHKIQQTTTDIDSILSDDTINSIVIATQHNTHAELVVKSLQANKHVFVEKPLAINHAELQQIKQAYSETNNKLLMVGFNRRFSPLIKKVNSLLTNRTSALNMIMTVNAGYIPATHWTQEPQVGGGRIIGEACHFVDLLRYLAKSAIVSSNIIATNDNKTELPIADNTTITLTFADGSIGTIHYITNGHSAYPKERLEIFTDGKILSIDNFRKLSGYGWSGFKSNKLWRQDKGQQACSTAFVHAINNGLVSPIAYEEIMEVSETIINLSDKVKQ